MESYSKVCDRPAVACELTEIEKTVEYLMDRDPALRLPNWRRARPLRRDERAELATLLSEEASQFAVSAG